MVFGETLSFFTRELVVYKVQRLMTGALIHQLGAILFIGLGFTFAGAFVLSVVVPKDQDRYKALLKDAHILMNRVPPYVWGEIGAGAREKFVRNLLFLSNVVTMSIITGIVAATMKTAVDNIIEGNHQIVERNHVVVLADKWDDQIVSVVKALDSVADSSQARPKTPIVLLTPMAKKPALASISESFSGTGRTPNVMVRTGDCMSLKDLHKVCVPDARHVLYLSSERNVPGSQQAANSQLLRKIKTQAALLRHLRNHHISQWEGTPAAVLAIPADEEGWPTLKNDFAVCEEQEFVGRLLSLCAHPADRGLAEVYNEILRRGQTDFITSKPLHDSYPWLVGKPFSELQQHFTRTVVCGLVRKSEALLAPHGDVVTDARDRLIFVASSDVPFRSSEITTNLGVPAARTQASPVTAVETARRVPPRPKPASSSSQAPPATAWWDLFGRSRKVVVLNWNERGGKTVAELKLAFPEDSTTVSLLTNSEDAKQKAQDAERKQLKKGSGPTPAGRVEVKYGDPLNQKDLIEAGVMEAECVVVLSDATPASRTSDSSDAHLLAVVESLARLPWPERHTKPSLVGLVCTRTAYRELSAACDRAGFTAELIMANYLEAGAVVQVLLNPELGSVYQTLLSKGNAELHLAPCSALLPCTNPSFASSPVPATVQARDDDELEMWSGIDGVFGRKAFGAATTSSEDSEWFRGTFGEVQAEAARRQQVAVGVRLSSGKERVILNPPGNKQLRLREDDRIILIGKVLESRALPS